MKHIKSFNRILGPKLKIKSNLKKRKRKKRPKKKKRKVKIRKNLPNRVHNYDLPEIRRKKRKNVN